MIILFARRSEKSRIFLKTNYFGGKEKKNSFDNVVSMRETSSQADVCLFFYTYLFCQRFRQCFSDHRLYKLLTRWKTLYFYQTCSAKSLPGGRKKTFTNFDWRSDDGWHRVSTHWSGTGVPGKSNLRKILSRHFSDSKIIPGKYDFLVTRTQEPGNFWPKHRTG